MKRVRPVQPMGSVRLVLIPPRESGPQPPGSGNSGESPVRSVRIGRDEYTYECERGPEYTLRKGSFTVAGRGPVKLGIELERLADLAAEGWWSGELHVHRPPEDIELLMKAEDLHVAPVITWVLCDQPHNTHNVVESVMWHWGATVPFCQTLHRLSTT